jgi:enoyl-CoA hydratase/carnithine racemase
LGGGGQGLWRQARLTGCVQLQTDAALAFVTLSHPGKLNAMSRVMWRELRDVFERLQLRSDVRAVIVSGEGGHFCAGGDISEYAAFRFEEASLRDFHEQDVWGALSAMLACDVPVLASLSGNCMGAGMEIASCCDLRLAGQSAKFGAPIARLGFPMAPREAALVARVAGELTAREMLLSAAALGAPTLLQRGFLNAVHEDAQLDSLVLDLAQSMARLAPMAARLNKQTLRALLGAVQSSPGAYDYAASPEHREGVTAFIEKRSPQF